MKARASYPSRARPLLGHQQHRGRAVGEGRGVAGRHAPCCGRRRAAGRQASERRVAPDRGRPPPPRSRRRRRHEDAAHLGPQPAVVRGRGGVRWLVHAISVLVLARDAVLLGHLLGGLAHRQARGRLGDRRRFGHQVARPQTREGLEASREAPARATRSHEGPGEPAAVEDRNVGEALRAARDADLGMSAQDRSWRRRRWPGWPRRRRVHGVGGKARRKARRQDHLARQIGRFHGRNHLAHHQGVDARPGPPRFVPPAPARSPWPGPAPSRRGMRFPLSRTASDNPQ